MMKDQEPFSFRKRLQSFLWAWKGLRLMFWYEHNSRIHAVVAVLVVTLGFLLGLSLMEWALIVVAISMVLVAEILNTAFEKLVDLVSPEHRPLAGHVKDLAAGAVLLAAIAAVIIGLLVFIPKVV